MLAVILYTSSAVNRTASFTSIDFDDTEETKLIDYDFDDVEGERTIRRRRSTENKEVDLGIDLDDDDDDDAEQTPRFKIVFF